MKDSFALSKDTAEPSALTDGSLKIVGFSTDPENNELGAAHMNYIVIWNEHNFKKEL